MKQGPKLKKELFIGATLQPIQNCQLLASCDDSTLFVSRRNLIIMNLQEHRLKSCLIEDEKILSATYHAELEIFLINTDKHLIALNKEPEIIARQRIPELLEAKTLIFVLVRHQVESRHLTRKDELLFTTNECMCQVSVTLRYQKHMLKGKLLSSLQIELDSKPTIVHYEWVAQHVYLERDALLICWNQAETYVFETPTKLGKKIQQLYIYDKILRRNKLYETDNKITTFEASTKHRYLIAAFLMGSLKVYKLDETKKYICEMKGHQKECTGLLIPQHSQDCLYSCGLDNSIRVWDLFDFNQVYHIRFDLLCSRIALLDDNLLFAKSVDGRRAFFIKCNARLMKPILSEAKPGRLVSLSCDGEWGVSLYSNNFVQAFLMGDYNNENRRFTQKIEFPIKYGFLRSSYKIGDECYAVCLQKGFSLMRLSKKQSTSQNFQLKRLVYNHSLQFKPNQKGKLIEMIHQKLLDTFFFTILEDWKNIPIAINVTTVEFLLGQALWRWDHDIKGKPNSSKCDYVILGTERGHIYFVDLKSRTHYYSRVNFHSDGISSISRLELAPGASQMQFISVTSTNEMAIWQLSEANPPRILFKINYNRDISVMRPISNMLAIGCKSGQFNVFTMQLSGEAVSFWESSGAVEQGHLKSILSIDYMNCLSCGLWLTAGEDHAIKIWRGCGKVLLAEIRVFSIIYCAVFARRGVDIVMAHGQNNQITVLASNTIPALRELLEELKDHHEGAEQLHQANISRYLRQDKQLVSPSLARRREKVEEADGTGLRSSGNYALDLQQLVKNRQFDRSIDLLLHPISQRKLQRRQSKMARNLSPRKEQAQAETLVLPKIHNRYSFVKNTYVFSNQQNEKKGKQLDVLEKSRIRFFSSQPRAS